MLVVKVEIWPGGRRAQAREIGQAAIANVSSLADVSSYVGVLVTDHGDATVAAVRGHRRAAGFWPLLARMFAPRASKRLTAGEQRVAVRMLDLITGAADSDPTASTGPVPAADDAVTVAYVAGLLAR